MSEARKQGRLRQATKTKLNAPQGKEEETKQRDNTHTKKTQASEKKEQELNAKQLDNPNINAAVRRINGIKSPTRKKAKHQKKNFRPMIRIMKEKKDGGKRVTSWARFQR